MATGYLAQQSNGGYGIYRCMAVLIDKDGNAVSVLIAEELRFGNNGSEALKVDYAIEHADTLRGKDFAILAKPW